MRRHESHTLSNAIVMPSVDRCFQQETQLRKSLTDALSEDARVGRIGFMADKNIHRLLPNIGPLEKLVVSFKNFARANGSIDERTMVVGEGFTGLVPILYANQRFRNGNNGSNEVYCPEFMVAVNPVLPRSVIGEYGEKDTYKLTSNTAEELGLVGFIRNRTVVIAEGSSAQSESLLSPQEIAEHLGLSCVTLADERYISEAVRNQTVKFLSEPRPFRPIKVYDNRTKLA